MNAGVSQKVDDLCYTSVSVCFYGFHLTIQRCGVEAMRMRH